MGDSFLYALQTTTHFVKPCYYTIYLRGRSWLITSPDRTTMDLLRTTLHHHRHRHRGAWLGHGVFYREHPTEHNKDSLYITDHNPYHRPFSTDDNLVLDLKGFNLDSPLDIDQFRKMYQFSNTSLFVMYDYDYTTSNSHLRLEGLPISIPSIEDIDHSTPWGPDYSNDYKEFLNSLYFL
jgi:hypothetical protein